MHICLKFVNECDKKNKYWTMLIKKLMLQNIGAIYGFFNLEKGILCTQKFLLNIEKKIKFLEEQ